MDQTARFQAIVARLPTPELQAEAMRRRDELIPMMGEFLPEVSDEQIASTAGSARGDAAIGMGQGRLERALMRQQGAENELMAGISGPKAVPSAWGPIMVRQAPISNIVKAIRAYKGGRDVSGAEDELSGLYDTQEGRLKEQFGAYRGENRKANERLQGEAEARIRRMLMGGGSMGGGY